MLRTAAVVAMLVSLPAPTRAQEDISKLIAICDHAAGSPLDHQRPHGLVGTLHDKVDPRVAIPACEAALRNSPGDARIMYQLGRAYKAAMRYESARILYEKADAKGYAAATNNLGVLYMNGQGVIADTEKGISLYYKAAAAGDPVAMRNIGALHYNGKKIPLDRAEGIRWYRMAAERGDEEAKKFLKNLSSGSGSTAARRGGGGGGGAAAPSYSYPMRSGCAGVPAGYPGC